MIRLLLIGLLTLFLTNCAQKTYEVKQEATKDGRILNEVPQWFVDAQVEKGLITNRDAENFIYGVGSGESPDLQMAIDKANNGDYTLIEELHELLKQPYAEQPEHEKWFAKRPEWARHKVGCSMLSCSS